MVSENFKIRCRLDVMRPIHFTVDNLPVFFEAPISEAVADRCANEVREKIKVVSFFIPETDRKEKTAGDTKGRAECCRECGGTHAEGECPLRFESGYELARQERELGSDRNLSGDEDLWF